MRVFNTIFIFSVVLCGVFAQAPTQAKPKDISLENVRIRVADEETGADWESTAFQNVAYPSGKSSALTASDFQKVQISFGVQDKAAKSALTPHQVFVVFSGPNNKEVILIPDLDAKSQTYRLDADLKTKTGKAFDNVSGKYTISLIVGDAKINSVQWSLGDVSLQFSSPSIADDYYAQKPEIVHMFRQPEKRPPEFVSNVFCLIIASLFVIMLALWLNIGLSFSGLSISGLIFQAALGLIFYIEFMFYVGNDMFTTLRYLSYVSPFAFYFGRRMLSHKSNLEEKSN